MVSYIRVAVLALLCAGAGSALAQTPVPAAGDPVVARVNGAEVRRSDVMLAIENLPQQYRQLPPEMLFGGVVSQIIDRKLVAQAAEKGKLGDDPVVKQRVASIRERVLQEAYLSREIEKEMTDNNLRARYEKQVKNAPGREEVHARHVLVQNEADAKGVIEDLRKGGDFAEMAKKRSSGPSAANGGDLGYFTREQMVPEFAEAAFAMKKGEVSAAPVKTQFGWHVIKVEDRRTAPPPSFEDSVNDLRQEMAQELIQARMEALRKDAKIERFGPDGKPVPAEPKQ